MQKQNIQIGVGSEFAATVAAESHHGATSLGLFRGATNFAEQCGHAVSALYYDVENRTARGGRFDRISSSSFCVFSAW